MSELSTGAAALVKTLFKGNESERMISAGVVRTILSDMTRLFFENRAARGKGILIFNPNEPEKSKYMTIKDFQDDISIAQEDMDNDCIELFTKMISIIEKEDNSDLALVTMVEGDKIITYQIDPQEANKKIDEYSNGLIL